MSVLKDAEDQTMEGWFELVDEKSEAIITYSDPDWDEKQFYLTQGHKPRMIMFFFLSFAHSIITLGLPVELCTKSGELVELVSLHKHR